MEEIGGSNPPRSIPSPPQAGAHDSTGGRIRVIYANEIEPLAEKTVPGNTRASGTAFHIPLLEIALQSRHHLFAQVFAYPTAHETACSRFPCPRRERGPPLEARTQPPAAPVMRAIILIRGPGDASPEGGDRGRHISSWRGISPVRGAPTNSQGRDSWRPKVWRPHPTGAGTSTEP